MAGVHQDKGRICSRNGRKSDLPVHTIRIQVLEGIGDIEQGEIGQQGATVHSSRLVSKPVSTNWLTPSNANGPGNSAIGSDEAGGHTQSDFPLANIEQDALDELAQLIEAEADWE